ncbi:MAG: c-type cytochrome, partial [Verrucomicrobiae bacterium]|nr:c-type cytochrome [Verrucomicrobiae bacterium]
LMNAEKPVHDLLSDPMPRVRMKAMQAFAQRLRQPGYRSVRVYFTPKQEALGALAAGAARLVGQTNNISDWEDRLGATVTGSDPHVALAAQFRGESTNLFLRQAAVHLLSQSSLRKGVFRDQFVQSDAVSVRLLALEMLRRLTNSTLTNFLSDPDPALVTAAGRAIHDVPIVEGFPALASFITKVDCPTNLHSRVIDACFRLGTQQHAQMLAGFAAREDVPDAARVLALRALGDWERPHPLDRVNGLWRPLVTGPRRPVSPGEGQGEGVPAASPSNPLLDRAVASQSSRNLGRASGLPELPPDLGRSASFEEGTAVRRNPALAQRAFLRVAGDLLNPFNLNEAGQPAGTREVLPIQIAVAETAARLRVKEAGTHLFEKFEKASTASELRQAILPALAALGSVQTGDAVAMALADRDPKLRAAAVPFVDRLDGDAATGLLAGLVPGKSGELPLAQAALAALGSRASADPRAADVLKGFSETASRTPLPAGLRLDLHEALRAAGLPGAVEATADRYAACLEGGDAARGRRVFLENPTVQCLRCHRIGSNGGTVGPDLTKVGSRLSRPDLLESVVTPNARLAAGFEPVVLTLTDGTELTGTVRAESGDGLTVEVLDPETGESASRILPKATIRSRERGSSAMPEGLADALSPFELRDLVEYLASLR